jgi:hypothetical protein
MMEIRLQGRHVVAAAAIVLVSCGGKTGDEIGSGGASSDGGRGAGRGGASTGGTATTGGTPTASGGTGTAVGGATAAIPSCTNPMSEGAPCVTQSGNCVGPCSNGWQVENICNGTAWEYKSVIPCAPDAPQCHNGNAFSGGALTPCCASGGLDCTGKPDGYPGFGCTPGEGSFCSCTCSQGKSICGC